MLPLILDFDSKDRLDWIFIVYLPVLKYLR